MTVSSWLNFGGPAPPGRGLRRGEIFWRAVFASLWALFFHCTLYSQRFIAFAEEVMLSLCLLLLLRRRNYSIDFQKWYYLLSYSITWKLTVLTGQQIDRYDTDTALYSARITICADGTHYKRHSDILRGVCTMRSSITRCRIYFSEFRCRHREHRLRQTASHTHWSQLQQLLTLTQSAKQRPVVGKIESRFDLNRDFGVVAFRVENLASRL